MASRGAARRGARGVRAAAAQGLFDAPYLSGLLSASGLHAAVFRYRFPGEAHALNLGFMAGRRSLLPNSFAAHGGGTGEPLRDAVLEALGRVPGAGRFAELGSVAITGGP